MKNWRTYAGWIIGALLLAAGYGIQNLDSGQAATWADVPWLSLGLGVQVLGYLMSLMSKNPTQLKTPVRGSSGVPE